MSLTLQSPVTISAEWLAAFVLVLGRVLGLVGLSPVFGSVAVPVPARAALAAAVALLLASSQRAQLDLPPEAIELFVLLVREFAIGAVMGMCIAALVGGVRAAGQLVEQQTGLALSELFNPQPEQSEPVLQRFYSVFAITVFLVIGGHHMVLSTLLESFEAVPISQSALPDSVVAVLTTLVAQSFQIALRVAAPVVVTLLLSGVALGFIARTAPQVQLFVTALPLRVLLGLFALAIALVGAGALVNEQTALFVGAFQQAMDDTRALPLQ